MKKLNKNEINCIVGEVRRIVNKKKMDEFESKILKDKDYKKLEKLVIEKEVIDKKLKEVNYKINDLVNFIRSKYDNKFFMNVNNYGDKKINISYNNNVFNNNNLYCDVVLNNIENENVGDLIEKLVKKYS